MMRVLSVDDSATARLYVKRAVEVLGFEFLEAAGAKEAFELLAREEGKVDLILLDWHMPEMDGMGMLKLLKADARFKDIPITMVTTEVERASVIEAIEAGAKHYVMKPFAMEALVAKILESLGLA
jgi:two-component system chemotaxis response regulator CheY